MKKYIGYFKIWFIVLGILLVAGIGCKVVSMGNKADGQRANTESPAERVFDYADKLTEEEEDALRAQIAETEDRIGYDIVIVTLNETLEEYVKEYEPIIGPVEPYQYTMVYADNFYDENKFGYNAPYGDGVLLVDNWYREKDGKIHSWLTTTGRAIDEYSQEAIDSTLSLALETVDEDPYGAYSKFVSYVGIDLGETYLIPGFISLPAALIIGLVFFLVHRGGKRGKKTITSTTYVESGRPKIREQQDIYLTKTVTKRKIERSSGSSGGGGSHTSAGGRSHGGGGHSR